MQDCSNFPEQHYNNWMVVALLFRHVPVSLQVTAPMTQTVATVVLLDATAASQSADEDISNGVIFSR